MSEQQSSVTDLTKKIVDLTKDESPARITHIISLIEEVQRNKADTPADTQVTTSTPPRCVRRADSDSSAVVTDFEMSKCLQDVKVYVSHIVVVRYEVESECDVSVT